MTVVVFLARQISCQQDDSLHQDERPRTSRIIVRHTGAGVRFFDYDYAHEHEHEKGSAGCFFAGVPFLTVRVAHDGEAVLSRVDLEPWVQPEPPADPALRARRNKGLRVARLAVNAREGK